MQRQYTILPLALCEPLLSDRGRALLPDARLSLDGTLLLRSLNHRPEVTAAMFKDGVDWVAFIDSLPKYTAEQVAVILDGPDWKPEGDTEGL